MPGLSGYGRQYPRHHEKKAHLWWSRAETVRILLTLVRTMGEMPWLNRDCLELVRPALLPGTYKGPFLEAERQQGSDCPQLARSQHISNICSWWVCMSLPRPRGQDSGLRGGPEGPNTRFSRLNRNSLPVPLLQLCRLPAYCFGLVFAWPLFLCNVPLSFLCSTVCRLFSHLSPLQPSPVKYIPCCYSCCAN